MQRENVERMLGVLCNCDYYAKRLGTALVMGESYQTIFQDYLPQSGALSQRAWETISNCHLMMVAWDPRQAHEWLGIVAERFGSLESHNRYAFVQGSIIGLFRAGTWLDENVDEEVVFHNKFLPFLAQAMCSPTKMDLMPQDLDSQNYVRQLAEAIKTYMFPTKKITGRLGEFSRMIGYIKKHGEDANFSSLDQLIIERVCHSLLADRTAVEKIAGAHFLLSQFGVLPNNAS
ncbi:MAG: hypothetical protein A3E36_04545 [Candidatus Andersenbacteria bacterium RIFCSPHIGHO2_12_FULL_45_11b]|uniref:Uncharacterized protein n=1 Tax=Candidatus Andersenbacteria bacterium RIFCSPHIGHO2_12_FULL_45_11b TaxID=1797282 RepID=A0A1G1XA37_9BACT|nr:MAG: hypothetical protein A3E36_04545 [Candidatus Andersenbacteria bacterium RIFCSPHIGHO2_12_FULL_45_11b]